MATPQPALFIEETALHLHVEFTVRPGADVSAVMAAITSGRAAATTLRGPNTVWGFGPELWRAFPGATIPAGIQPFHGVSGIEGRNAPATQRDIWLWCHGNAYEKVWRTAYDASRALAVVADVAAEQSAFTPADNRDPIGFIDGTENPALDEALEVALIPGEAPGAGGSAVLVQKWVHDLAAFEALSLPDQEAVIGRTKPDSVELEGTAQPPTSHVSRNVVSDGTGHELHIYRRNTPFASVAELGTMFIGCSRDPARIDLMLDRMFGATGDGLTDHLTRFSAPVSGSYYFVPSQTDLGVLFGGLETTVPPAAVQPVSSGSLGIGSLRGMSSVPGSGAVVRDNDD